MHRKVGFLPCEVAPDFSLGLECWGSSLSKGWGSEGCRRDPAGGSSGMGWGRTSLRERRQRPCVVCSPPPPERTAFPAQRLYCEVGLSSQWGWQRVGGEPKEWPWVQSGKGLGNAAQQGPREHPGPRTSLVSSSLPPMSVLQRRGGAWGQLGSPIYRGQDLAIRCWLCTVHGQCPEPWQGPEPTASWSHLDFIVLLSISKLKGVCLHRAGHGGPAARLGCPPLFVQALPRSPSLGQDPR